jgi:hypothetical protein
VKGIDQCGDPVVTRWPTTRLGKSWRARVHKHAKRVWPLRGKRQLYLAYPEKRQRHFERALIDFAHRLIRGDNGTLRLLQLFAANTNKIFEEHTEILPDCGPEAQPSVR